MNKLFDSELEFEINLIGYKSCGESIVFFLKADKSIIYSGIVDCYEVDATNMAAILLKDNHVNSVDFLCWTHPHEDHTMGMENILGQFCNSSTEVWIPPFVLSDIEKLPTKTIKLYKTLFEKIRIKQRNSISIREVSDTKLLYRTLCLGNCNPSPILFEIKSFAPDSSLLNDMKINERFNNTNVYSIGLIINIGHYCMLLSGDVENQTLSHIPEFNFEEYKFIDYIKIPHHGSKGSDALMKKFVNLCDYSPSVAATTVYRQHKLPNQEILELYKGYKGIELYSTGSIVNFEKEKKQYGIIRTTFDVLEKRKFCIETHLYGNAISIE